MGQRLVETAHADDVIPDHLELGVEEHRHKLLLVRLVAGIDGHDFPPQLAGGFRGIQRIAGGGVLRDIVGDASEAVRLSIVNQRTRQLMMQKTAMRFASRSAVRSFDSSALQPDLRILWKTSIFQRMAYQSIFSIAAARVRTGRSVISFQSIGLRPLSFPRSLA